ncbi:2-oxoisovalerate dehydrogenase subunit alpha, mitochondrial [Habropoda laboriosa]|uniref:2-oxoisovalerate dehydrogenase subunit alpha n=1 Tax=Habropoda laboriosa TaxID=597456 RepID=A0A0L7QXL4_9HYME|nr:PREDICTED: 2-oxoisovalerate dehydrogenase subunit alpha, mitochondrial [Habropoda laboriosa]KOC63343.1 2-oxoisovalerate dehydrogenase subunit alpha, mitochondrial [Habropoda laboriosa]
MIEKVFLRCGKHMYSRNVLQQVQQFYNSPTTNIKIGTSINAGDPSFLGIQTSFSSELKFINKECYDSLPLFRILDSSKHVRLPEDFKLDEQTFIRMYRKMITLNIMDKILYESQRQGRISFYMTNTGEEYREAGVLLWRGHSIRDFMNQCYGNHKDTSKGRQMPVHYGSKKLNFVTISSPLTTQLPQAVGTAYAFKRSRKGVCVVCYFGEGAASEGDAHAAFNFAATLECPIVFVCRNNGYAISTPSLEQFKGDGIAARGPAYGIYTIRVDGNDILAMYYATRAARELCIMEGKPVLIEAMSYRIGHHSTSDDSTAYRSINEIDQWKHHTPIIRYRDYLESVGLWCEQREQELNKCVKNSVLLAFAKAEKELKPCWKELFTDIYHTMPKHIRKQMCSMEDHVTEFHKYYPLHLFKQT